MFKRYGFGFEWRGLVLFLIIMVPNFIWFVIPSPNDLLRFPHKMAGSCLQSVRPFCLLERKHVSMNETIHDAHNFTDGPILSKLIRFSWPVLLALLLQATYGAVDLLVVGQFASSADVSAVATGSNIMMTLTGPLSSFAMGITVLLGRQIGSGKGKEGGSTVGAGISLFTLFGIILTVVLTAFAEGIAAIMQAPEQAFVQTVSYVRICGAGILIIVFYNLIGSIFRGIGDSKTPLIAVMIACIFNIFGDLFLVAACHMGAAGAAIATVAAQAVSVVISLLFIRKQTLPFYQTEK